MNAWSGSAHCLSGRPGRSRPLTLSLCGSASAIWCSPTLHQIPREAGEVEVAEEEEAAATGPRGEASGLEVVDTIVITTKGAPAHSSHGVIQCWLGVRHPGASIIQEEGAREEAELEG